MDFKISKKCGESSILLVCKDCLTREEIVIKIPNKK